MRQRTSTNRTDLMPKVPDVEPVPDAAGFWRRLGGFVVDIVLCFGIPSVASSLVPLGIGYSSSSAVIDVAWMAVLAAIVLVYFTYFSMRGASPGMRLVGIKVVDLRSGNPPDLPHALIRAALLLLLIASWFILVLLSSNRGSGDLSRAEIVLLNFDYVIFLVSFFGHVWIAWDKKRQTLQDKVARVAVVRKTAVIEPVDRRARSIDPLEWRM